MESRERTERLGTAPLRKLMVVMAIPGVLASISNAMYNITDRLFLGNFVSTTALGAVGATGAVGHVITALNVLFSVGGSALLSLTLGKKDYERTNQCLTSLIISAAVLGFMVGTGFLAVSPWLTELCGMVPGTEMYDMGLLYLRILSVGYAFVFLNQILVSAIKSEGNVGFSMIVSMIGCVLNVFLNAFFLLVLDMGVRGVAYATVISQFFSCFCCVGYFMSQKSIYRWAGVRNARFRDFILMAKTGMGPSVFQILNTISNLLLNQGLRRYGDLCSVGGDLALSALTVITTVENLFVMTVMGINGGVAPIISYNYGRKSYERVRRATLGAQAVSFLGGILVWLLFMLAPQMIFRIFSGQDAAMIAYGTVAIRISRCFIFTLGFQTLSSMYFSAVGKAGMSILVSVLRQGVFLIPGLVILPLFFGLNGVLAASAVSDACSSAVIAFFYFRDVKKLRQAGNQACIMA